MSAVLFLRVQLSRLSNSSLWQRLRRELLLFFHPFFLLKYAINTPHVKKMSINLHWLHLHFYTDASKIWIPASTVTLQGRTHIGQCERGGAGDCGDGAEVGVEGWGEGGMRLLWKAARASMHTQTSCDSASSGLLWLKPDLLFSFFLLHPYLQLRSPCAEPGLSQGPITCAARDWPRR